MNYYSQALAEAQNLDYEPLVHIEYEVVLGVGPLYDSPLGPLGDVGAEVRLLSVTHMGEDILNVAGVYEEALACVEKRLNF